MVEMSFKWLRQCTEIPVMVLLFSFMLSAPINTNFIIYRTCYVSLGYNQSDCARLGSKNTDNFTEELEKLVQPFVTVITMTQSLLTQILPAALCLFVGPWSDKHGRKPLMISTLVGLTYSGIVSIIVVSISTLSPWYLLLGNVPANIFGGTIPFIMAILCYITDITTEESRGMRMGIFEAMIAVGMLLGTATSSYVFSLGGYIMVYSLTTICYFFLCLYVIFVITETVTETTHQDKTSIFTLDNILDMLRTVYKGRENYGRCILVVIFIMTTILTLANTAEGSIFYLFLREKFNWDLEHYTLYSSITTVVGIAGTFTALVILYKLLKIAERFLILIGLIMYCCAAIILGLASKDWHIYLAGGVRCICGIVSPMSRSLISKLITKEETGKVFSIALTIDALVILIASPLYTVIYNNTLDINPGLFNFVTAGLVGGSIILALVVIVIQNSLLNRYSYSPLIENVEE